MKKLLLLIVLTSISLMQSGCAATGATNRVQEVASISYEIELECKSANRLGCRYKGSIYPWNAWAEAKGFDSIEYEVKAVSQSGNTATVLIVKR